MTCKVWCPEIGQTEDDAKEISTHYAELAVTMMIWKALSPILLTSIAAS